MATLISDEGQRAKKSGFITRATQNANAISKAMQDLNEMYKEAVISGYATSITDDDFVGDNDHVDKAALVALFATVTALEALLVANTNAHYKNLYAFKRG